MSNQVPWKSVGVHPLTYSLTSYCENYIYNPPNYYTYGVLQPLYIYESSYGTVSSEQCSSVLLTYPHSCIETVEQIIHHKNLPLNIDTVFINDLNKNYSKMNSETEVTSNRDKLNDKYGDHTGGGRNSKGDHASDKNRNDNYRKPCQDQQRNRGRGNYHNKNASRSKYDNNDSYSKQINNKTVNRNEKVSVTSSADSSTHRQNNTTGVVTSGSSREGRLMNEHNNRINTSKTEESPHYNRSSLNDGFGQAKTNDKNSSFSKPAAVSDPMHRGNNSNFRGNQRYSHSNSNRPQYPRNYDTYQYKNFSGIYNNTGGYQPFIRGMSGGYNRHNHSTSQNIRQETPQNSKTDKSGGKNSYKNNTSNDPLGMASWPQLSSHKESKPNVKQGNNKTPLSVKKDLTGSVDSTVNSCSSKGDKSTDKEPPSSSDSDRSKQDDFSGSLDVSEAGATSLESKNHVIKCNTDDDLCKPPCIFSSESNSFKDKSGSNTVCLSKNKTNALLVDVNKVLECGSISSSSVVSQDSLSSLKNGSNCSPVSAKDCTKAKGINSDDPVSSNSEKNSSPVTGAEIHNQKPDHRKEPDKEIMTIGDKSSVETDKNSLNSGTSNANKNKVTAINQNKNNSKDTKNESGNTDKFNDKRGKKPRPPNDQNKPKKRKRVKREPKGSIYTIGLKLKDSFDDQAMSMINQFEMKEREKANVLLLNSDLYRVFAPLIPNLELIMFGSMTAGTAFSNSDVDICLKCYVGFPCKSVQKFIVKYYRNIYQGGSFNHVVKIANARVPIVKAVHAKTGISVDISFLTDPNEPHYGSCNSFLVKHLCSYDHRVRNLIMLVLFWGKHHGFVGKYQISSFTFILMVIFYLQIVEILPPLYKLISIGDDECTWPNSFDNDVTLLHNSNTESLESLYLGFFTFFSAVRFDEVVISVYAGELVLGVLFETPDLLPSCYSGYRRLVEGGHEKPLTRNIMCVQEPFNMSWNTVRGVNTSITDMLKYACHNVCNTFAKFSSNRTLSVVHSQYQYAHDDEDSYSWQLPCPQDLESPDWFKKVLQATRRVFSDILLMDIEDCNQQFQFDDINFSTFFYCDECEENPVRLIVSCEYSVASNERSKLLQAYKHTSYTELEKETKASALFLETLKKKEQHNALDATLYIARNEKNGSVEITVNKYLNKRNQRRKHEHKVFVNYLRNDNFKRFLYLMLGSDSGSKSEERTSCTARSNDASATVAKTVVTNSSKDS